MERDQATGGRLGRTLQRLSDTLAWPSFTAAELPGEGVSDPVAAVSAALAAAHSVRDGGAFVRLRSDAARLEAAAQAGAGDPQPLAGVPLAVKDLLAVAGHPLGGGSAQRDGASAERRDAAAVAALRGQGAILVGLVALHEFAYGVTGVNAHTGSPPNPIDPARIPGGSSSGSAVAVATGGAALALGTDTGGSVRIPAALCGVVGFKPAYGEYPVDGVFPLAPSLDHVGLIGACVGVIRRAHAATGHDPGLPRLPARVGVVEEDVEAAEPVVRDRVRAAMDTLADAGARVEPVRWPSADRSFAASTAIMSSEAAAIHGRALAERPDRFSPEIRARLEAGLRIPAPTYVAAKAEQARLREEVTAVLQGVDAVVGPAVPLVAPPLADAADPDLSAALVRNTRLLNVAGVPALALPLSGDGLPVGLQVVAPTSAALLGAAAGLEHLLAT